MRGKLLLAAAVGSLVTGACTQQGSFELVLSLPQDPALRPTGVTTVTVVLTRDGEQPIATTSVLADNEFSIGDVEIADDVRVEVQLRDVSNRLVGVGEAPDLIDIVGERATTVEIPVRRPFVYASNGTSLFSFDPTLDSTDGQFQSQLAGDAAAPKVVVSVAGDRLAIVGDRTLSVLATDTNQVVGAPIALPGATRDAAAVPGTHKVAVAHDQGIAIVDLDTGAVANAAGPAVDRVTVGPSSDGRLRAHGLIGRVEPALNPLETCGGSSSIVTIDVDAPGALSPVAVPEPVSDLAAAPENVGLFATLPCSGKVVKLSGDADGAGAAFTDFATLPRASVIAVAGGRVFAAGTEASQPVCANQLGQDVTCQPDSAALCPPPGSPPPSVVDYVSQGAHLVVLSIPIAGGMPITIDLPARRETIFDTDDPAEQHAQVLQAFGAVPLDLVALPGGQFIGLIASNNYFIQQLTSGATTILPCLDATTADWLLIDMASASIAQRVRTSCQLVVGPADDFPNWECDTPPLGERSAFGDYVPVSIGALFGAR